MKTRIDHQYVMDFKTVHDFFSDFKPKLEEDFALREIDLDTYVSRGHLARLVKEFTTTLEERYMENRFFFILVVAQYVKDEAGTTYIDQHDLEDFPTTAEDIYLRLSLSLLNQKLHLLSVKHLTEYIKVL